MIALLITIIFSFPCLLQSETITLSGNSSGQFMQQKINKTINIDGQLDKTFKGITFPTSPTFYAYSYVPVQIVALQPDGKIILAGPAATGGTGARFSVARYTKEGLIDTTFGTNGITVITNSISGGTPTDNDLLSDVGLQSNGKIILVGATQNQIGSYFAVARLLPNGELDPSFGVEGPSPVAGATYLNGFITGGGDTYDYPNSMAIQADDKIVLGGYCVGPTNSFPCARFTADGQPDSSFGVGGPSLVVGATFINGSVVPNGAGAPLQGLAIQADGKIIATGGFNFNDSGTKSYLGIARFTTEGTLDVTFGQPGSSNVPGTAYVPGFIAPGANFDTATSVTIQPNGNIIVGGYSSILLTSTCFILACFKPNGALDESFGIGELSIIPGTIYLEGPIAGGNITNFDDECMSVALQADNAILAGGFSASGSTEFTNYRFLLARFSQNGVLDQSFGVNGISIIDHEIINGQPSSYLETIAIQPDGNVVAAGWSGQDAGSSGNLTPAYFSLVRFFNPPLFNAYKATYTEVGAGLNC